MSPKLPVVDGKDLARVARRLGFLLDRQKGSHAVYYRATDKARIVIPMHSGRSIHPKTLGGILEDMGITSEQLADLL